MDGKTKRYKHGDYRAYKFWTDDQWNGLSENDKAQWTEYSDEEPAAIPKEVIEFTKDNNLKTKEPCCKECKTLKEYIEALEVEIVTLKGTPTEPTALANSQCREKLELSAEEEKQLIKDKLTELGIPFRANTGLPKLLIKLEEAENANNTE